MPQESSAVAEPLARALRLRNADNVAVVTRPLTRGSLISLGDLSVESAADIPLGHKVAVTAIAHGQPIVKYGQLIGYAKTDIAPGEHVHTHNIGLGQHANDRTTDHDLSAEYCRDFKPVELFPDAQMRHFPAFL